MTDANPRDLIKRLADELDHYRQLLMGDGRETHALATEARAFLAQHESIGDRIAKADAAIEASMERVRAIASSYPARVYLAQPEPEEEWYSRFGDWLEREMPEGTVIGDPLWWASKIADYLARAYLAQPEPSLTVQDCKKQALQALNDAVKMADDAPPEGIRSNQADIIRRALEQLPDNK